MRYNLLAVLLLGLAVALNLGPIMSSPPVATIRSAVFFAVYPFEWTVSTIFKEAKTSALFLVKSYGADQKIEELQRKLKEANAEIALLKNLEAENLSLRSALRFAGGFNYHLVPANIIGRDGKHWNSEILTDAGADKGAQTGMTVISDRGLVGKVTEVSKNASKVMLITSPQSSVGIMLPKGSIFGIANGGGGSKLNLQYISESASIEVRDPVVISRTSNLYVPGVYVGKVSKVEKKIDGIFQKVEVEPATDFSKLGIVFLCKPY